MCIAYIPLQVADDEEEVASMQQLEEQVQNMLEQRIQQQQQTSSVLPAPSPPIRARSLSVTAMRDKMVTHPGGRERRQSLSSDTEMTPKPPPRRKRGKRSGQKPSDDSPKEVWT